LLNLAKKTPKIINKRFFTKKIQNFEIWRFEAQREPTRGALAFRARQSRIPRAVVSHSTRDAPEG
jgi:hypothetical protein